jgi:Carboxypeptidase regulatory-like domain/TonB dependent receptor
MYKRSVCWAAALAVLLVCALTLMMLPAAFAQETNAGVQGYVKDQSGAAVAGVVVQVSSKSMMGVRQTETDTTGFYRISGLPPSVYTITFTAKGFRVVKREDVSLEVGRLPNVDVQLEVGVASEVIEVRGETPTVDVTQSKVAVTINRDDLSGIPIGRSFQSVIPFAPGARQEPLQSTTGNRTGGFQIDGASDGENVYLVDGINTTQVNVGGVGKGFQSDFIQEVQVKSSSFEAEFGGALGGVINAVPKRGSQAWHGELKTYYQTSALDANDPCASGFTAAIGGSTVCGLRLDPTAARPSVDTGTRQDGTPQYYIPKKDARKIIEPGYEVGGPVFTDRLWLFSSYIPTIDTTDRLTNFIGKNPGPRRLSSTFLQHNMFNRLDFRAFDSLRLFGDWNYAYSRTQGQLGSPDSAYGQLNTGASTDPGTFRSDNGTVNPLSVYSFGGDWTPTSKLLISGRYGYFFSNNESRGKPVGTRYIYDATVKATSQDLSGATFPANTPFNTAGFANIPNNVATAFDAFKRKSFNVDASYFVGHFLGGHTFKGGYFWSTQANNVLVTANTNVVDLWWGTAYTPLTSTTACDSIKAQNAADPTFGKSVCGGKYGYFFTGNTTTSNTGGTTQTAQALYVQDAWTVGRGLTLNLGVRFDTESLPAYDPKRFPSLNFGWGQKIAPRLGAAYDLLHNGKVKVYASYGKFFDIMKMNLARGSFGSDYWHECVYTLDFTDFTTITPTLAKLGGCPASGPAPGVTVGRFIENVDFRATKADPQDPAIDVNMNPMSQHEFVTGVDWAINPAWSLETRYSRKRLDNAIEDMSITDNLGFYIGNPGSKFADVLHRNVVIPDANGNNYLLTPANGGPFCAECPGVVPAIRRYDGVEFRLTHRGGSKWYGSASYTYSKLTGNYPGLTNSDPTDGGGGRHNPNNTRLFDLPTMTYLPNGKIDDGPLSTDRPNTAKVYGYYRLKWFGMETNLGVIQDIFQGTPINTCLPVVGTASACQWAAGRGNEVIFARTPGDYQPDSTKPNFCTTCGDFVASKTIQGARTPAYLQTDFQVTHTFNLSKTHENYKLALEGFVSNLLNQRSVLAVSENVNGSINGQLISPVRGGADRFSGDPHVDWNMVMRPYSYVDALNGAGAFGATVQVPCATPGSNGCGSNGFAPTVVQSPMTLASRYGMGNVFQTARQLRLAVRFIF